MHALTALRHPNFAWFIGGQLVALVGYWMQQIALTWLVYRLTGSAMLLGVLGFAANLPVLLLAPWAGLWADRVNRHRAMLAIQVLEMLQAVALAVLAVTRLMEVWHVIALAALMGIFVAIELPVRHAYLRELVGSREEIPKAVAVTSLMANFGRLAGPAIGGLVIAGAGESACFVLNALSYVAVMVSFAFIRPHPQAVSESHPPLLRGMQEGLAYVWTTVPIRALLMLLAALSIFVASYGTLMPAVVAEVFGGGAETLGFMVSAAGFGALAATLALASRRSVRGLTGTIVAAAAAAGIALMLVALSRTVWVSLGLMAVVGFSILAVNVSVNMILQTIVDDDKRGRVMSLYTTAFLGMAPVGALVAGSLAQAIGAANTLLAGGAVCIAAAVAMWRYLPRLKAFVGPIYDRLGITRR